MPTEATFRFSTYLTLALSCAAVGYAQAGMLPEVPYFAALAVLALGALYFLETRYELLSIPAANRLGAVVGAAFLAWAAYRVKREIDTGEFEHIGWQTLLVALCGPLVMLVLAAKAARRDKHAGDYWALHGTALAGVGLAAAFADEALAFALSGLYLVAAVWSMALFHLARAAGRVPPVPAPDAAPPLVAFGTAAPHGTRTGFATALGVAVVAAATAVPLYLVTPRSAAPKAELGGTRVEIGYNSRAATDLRQGGRLKPKTGVAFEVLAAHPDGTPKTDLDADQRWRGRTHERYKGGVWDAESVPRPAVAPLPDDDGPWRAPDLGPGQYELTFELPPGATAHFVADPVRWVPAEPPPLAALGRGRPRAWKVQADGSFFWDAPRGLAPRYVQAHAPGADLGPGFRLRESAREVLTAGAPERVRAYAEARLDELAARGTRDDPPADWRDPIRRQARPEFHARIARALARHLAETPTLRYTLDLEIKDRTIDPVEDFLFNTRAGNCERFATALVLMLRSQGIPAAYVRGYKGCEHLGDGRYAVKEEFAHAWAEALVSEPVPAGQRAAGGPDRRYHWLSLDPTPGGEAAAGAGGPWWEQANSWLGSRFERYVRNYTAEQRRKDLAALVAWLARWDTLAGFATLAAALLGLRAARNRRAADRRAVAAGPDLPGGWFGALARLLAAHGITPAPGDTPLEFAAAAADALAARPGCAALTGVPLAWAGAYYEDRFGGSPPTPERRAELDAGLNALRTALEARGSS